ncbi:MAG: metallophosphoesterase [Clostridia bacterium]|nr:metallophosphoesterase [Clostridia bacterium]
MKELNFFVITDTHYFEHSLGCWGKEYENFMDFEQKCFAETAAINEAAFEYLANDKRADIVLIAGDLSFNGEKESHESFCKLLKKLKKSGKDIYVVTAGHDFNEHPFAFNETGRIEPEGVDFEDLYDYYKDYGYKDAIAFNKEHLSYVAELSKDVRLLVLCNDTKDGKGKAYDEDFLEWVEEQAKKAKEDGKMMIAMEHYPLLPGQPLFWLVGDAMQKNGKALATILADNDVHLIFTGHMHNQSVNVHITENNNKIYDVCTGSLIGCPAFMRLVTIKDERTVEIESIPVPEFEWDKGGKTGKQYLQDQFERMIRTMLTSMVNDPKRIMRKLRLGDNDTLAKVITFFGKAVNGWSVGKVAKMLCIKVDNSVKDIPFAELAIELVRSIFEGDQPFVEGTPKGDAVLELFNRLRPILNKISLKTTWGEPADLYEILKHTAGNYGISDNNCTLKLK